MSTFFASLNESSNLLRVNARIAKWESMLSDWDSFSKSKRLKRRCRKGVPSSVRGRAWFKLARCAHLRDSYDRHLYFRLLNMEDSAEVLESIQKDVDRTFPENVMFQEGVGKECLTNLLRAYALLDPEVGYCQGMAFIAGMLLLYLEEEAAFWTFLSLMHFYDYKNTYAHHMTKLKETMYTLNALMQIHMPDLWRHLIDIGVNAELYAPQWFMTFFIVSFPLPVALRLFDSFLYDGKKTLLRASIAYFKCIKHQLLRCGFVEVVETIQKEGRDLKADLFLKKVFKVKISYKKISEIEKEFARNSQSLLGTRF